MEQLDQPVPTPTRKIYNGNAIWAGAFLGGPLVAGYFIAENFNAFREADKARKTWLYTILATIVIFGGIFLLPDASKIPGQFIPLVYTAIAAALVRHFQGPRISAHLSAGGPTYGWGRIIGVALAGLALTVVVVVGVSLLNDPTLTATSKNYGSLQHEILFKKSNISETEVDRVAEALTQTSFFDDFVRKSVFVKTEANAYVIFIPLLENAWKEPETVAGLEQLRSEVQEHIPDHKIIFDLCEDLQNVKKRLE